MITPKISRYAAPVTRKGLWRFGTALLALVLVMTLSVSVAFAITKQELFKLKEQKVPDVVVLSVLKDSGPLNLTKADLAKLKKDLGAGDELIKFLKDNGHVLADTATSGGGGSGDPAPELAPAENDPDAIKAEEARKKAEEDAKIRAEAEKLRNQEKAANAKEAELNRMLTQLADAQSMVESGKNMEAAAIFLGFLELGPDPASEVFYEAKFGLASALFKERIYSGAAGPVLEVIMQGPEKTHFVEAFYMLRTLTQENGYAPPQLEDLTKFYVDNLDAKFQDDFNYYLGKFFYDYNKLELSLKYLAKVSDTSPIKASAYYLTGVAQIDPDMKQYKSAVNSFQNAIVAAETIEDTDPQIRELGYLALARVGYEVHNYDGALYYYNKVPRLSPRRATALFESSWTYFLKNDYQRAMGTFHSLNSPFYSQWYYPDLRILEATVYMNLCKFGDAKEALVSFKQRYLDIQPILQRFLESTSDPQVFYETVVTAYEGGTTTLPMPFVQAVLADISFYDSHRVIKNLTHEDKKLRANMERLGEFGQTVLERVEGARKNQLLEAGIQVQQILTRADQDLTEWSIKADEIDFEIDAARAAETKRALLNSDYAAGAAPAGTTLFVVADDWQLWPFEGEYWVDEIDNYRSFLRSECIEQ